LVALYKQHVERWSYRRLVQEAMRLAHGLAAAGIGRDEPVALMGENRPEWIVACLAVIRAGAVPVDVQFGDEALTHVLNDSDARLLFTTHERAGRLERLDIREELKRPVLLDGREDEESSLRHWQTDEVKAFPAVDPDARAALFYTSGTTGRPKGVPLSHRNLTFQLATLLDTGLVTEHDRVLLPLPLHHVYAFAIGMLGPMAFGLPIAMPSATSGPKRVRRRRHPGRSPPSIRRTISCRLRYRPKRSERSLKRSNSYEASSAPGRREDRSYGIRLLRHARGNPDMELGRNLSDRRELRSRKAEEYCHRVSQPHCGQ
jgi:long-chain acyl-CoA synthetase